jgi:hypothetical protein
LPQLASNSWAQVISLLSSWDYIHAPLCPALQRNSQICFNLQCSLLNAVTTNV